MHIPPAGHAQMFRRLAQVFAITALAGLSIFSAAQYWSTIKKSWSADSLAKDPVSSWETKIARVKLPPDVGNEIGYVADWDINPDYAPIDQDEEYVLTQYALAPRIVKRGENYEWLIGNFTLPGANDWLSQHFKDAKIHYYGYGIYLIHRLRP